MLSPEEFIFEEDDMMHRLIDDNIAYIPDFHRLFQVRDRWVNFTHNLAIWSSAYHELSTANEWYDIFAVINTNKKASTISVDRLREFIDTFPTILWLSLLRTQSKKIGAFRILIAADRLNFIDNGIDLLEEELGKSDLFNHLRKNIYPDSLTKLMMREIATINTATLLLELYKVQIPTFKNMYSKKHFMREVNTSYSGWGIVRIALKTGLYSNFNAKDWTDILNARDRSIDIPRDILEEVVSVTNPEQYDDYIQKELVDILLCANVPDILSIVLKRNHITDIHRYDRYDLSCVSNLDTIRVILERSRRDDETAQRLLSYTVVENLEDDAIEFLCEVLTFTSILPIVFLHLRNDAYEIARRIVNVLYIKNLINNDIEYYNEYLNTITSIIYDSNDKFYSEKLRVIISPLNAMHDMHIISTVLREVYSAGDYGVKLLEDIVKIPVDDNDENRQAATNLFNETINQSQNELSVVIAKTYLIDVKKVQTLQSQWSSRSRIYKELEEVCNILLSNDSMNKTRTTSQASL